MFTLIIIIYYVIFSNAIMVVRTEDLIMELTESNPKVDVPSLNLKSEDLLVEPKNTFEIVNKKNYKEVLAELEKDTESFQDGIPTRQSPEMRLAVPEIKTSTFIYGESNPKEDDSSLNIKSEDLLFEPRNAFEIVNKKNYKEVLAELEKDTESFQDGIPTRQSSEMKLAVPKIKTSSFIYGESNPKEDDSSLNIKSEDLLFEPRNAFEIVNKKNYKEVLAELEKDTESFQDGIPTRQSSEMKLAVPKIKTSTTIYGETSNSQPDEHLKIWDKTYESKISVMDEPLNFKAGEKISESAELDPLNIQLPEDSNSKNNYEYDQSLQEYNTEYLNDFLAISSEDSDWAISDKQIFNRRMLPVSKDHIIEMKARTSDQSDDWKMSDKLIIKRKMIPAPTSKDKETKAKTGSQSDDTLHITRLKMYNDRQINNTSSNGDFYKPLNYILVIKQPPVISKTISRVDSLKETSNYPLEHNADFEHYSKFYQEQLNPSKIPNSEINLRTYQRMLEPTQRYGVEWNLPTMNQQHLQLYSTYPRHLHQTFVSGQIYNPNLYYPKFKRLPRTLPLRNKYYLPRTLYVG